MCVVARWVTNRKDTLFDFLIYRSTARRSRGDRVMAVERKIRKAPAEGYKGIAIKLAPEMVQGPDGSPEFHLLESIYKTAVKLSDGVDIAAQVKRW